MAKGLSLCHIDMQTFAGHTNMQKSACLEVAMDALPITTPRQAGIYVRQAREAQGLTRATLAKKAGVSERLLASLELGDATGIRLDKLLAIFNALGLALAAQGISSKRITSNQPTFRMPICNLVAPPDAIALNVFAIATVAAQPFRLSQTPPLRPSSTTRPSPILPCPISESRLPQTHLPNQAQREVANGQQNASDYYLRRTCGNAHTR